MLPVIFVQGDCLEWVESSRDQLVWSFANDIVFPLQQSFFQLRWSKKALIPFKSTFDAIMFMNLCIWVVTFFDSHDEPVFHSLLCCAPAIFINGEDMVWFDLPCEIAIKLLQKIIIIEKVIIFGLIHYDSLE